MPDKVIPMCYNAWQATQKYRKGPFCMTGLNYIMFSTTGDKKAQPYTLDTAKALAMTAVDIMTDPAVMATIREDFKQDLLRKQEQN